MKSYLALLCALGIVVAIVALLDYYYPEKDDWWS